MVKKKRKKAEPPAGKALPASRCVPVYDELRATLATKSSEDVEVELQRLHLFSPRFAGAYSDEPTDPKELASWKDAVLKLLLAVLDAKGSSTLRTSLTAAILNLGTPAGDDALFDRYEADRVKAAKADRRSEATKKGKTSRPKGGRVHALDAFLAWARTRATTLSAPDRARLLPQLFLAAGETPRRKEKRGFIDYRAFDDAFTRLAPEIPLYLLQSVAGADWIAPMARFERALQARLLGGDLTLDALIALLHEEGAPKKTFPIIAEKILEIARAANEANNANIAKSEHDDRAHAALAALFTHHERVGARLLKEAVALLSPRDAFDLLVPHLRRGSWRVSLWDILDEHWPLLRDPRWLPFAIEQSSGAGGTPKAMMMVIAIATDPDNESRDDALAVLLQRVKDAGDDVIDRRQALEDIGRTGHPGAVPPLIAAMEDRKIGSAMALTLAALGKCGTLASIPLLEARALTSPTWRSYFEAAIAMIKRRATQLSRERIIATCDHPDPTIANLARAARAGDDEATAVLEDALRERGELPNEV